MTPDEKRAGIERSVHTLLKREQQKQLPTKGEIAEILLFLLAIAYEKNQG